MASTAAYANHPCFGAGSRKKVGRLHLPVARRSFARVKFAPTTKPKPAVMPEEGLNMLRAVVDNGTSVDIVGITGPGDPLANVDITLTTLGLVREAFPDMQLCLTTVGIGLADAAEKLAGLKLSHVTVLVDAVSAEVAKKLYAWIRPSTKTVPLAEAVDVLLAEQAKGVGALVKAGISVKINTTVYPGVNAGHVEDVAAAMKALGAEIMAVIPFASPAESDDPDMPDEPGSELMRTVRDQAARHMELMPAWDECGEDVVGSDKPDKELERVILLPKPTKDKPNVAVVSSSGMDVDLHLGHAVKALVYGPREDGLNCLLESRDLPEPGTGANRWKQLAKTLDDCFVLLAASAGDKPKEILSKNGIAVIVTDGEIEPAVDALYGGGKKKGKGRK